MTHQFHFMTDEIHFMTEPTNSKDEHGFCSQRLLNECSFSIMSCQNLTLESPDIPEEKR